MIFNVENLFHRFDFGRSGADKYLAVAHIPNSSERETLANAYYNALQDETHVFTALAIAEGEPDVVCLQEVDTLRALDYFHVAKSGKSEEANSASIPLST